MDASVDISFGEAILLWILVGLVRGYGKGIEMVWFHIIMKEAKVRLGA